MLYVSDILLTHEGEEHVVHKDYCELLQEVSVETLERKGYFQRNITFIVEPENKRRSRLFVDEFQGQCRISHADQWGGLKERLDYAILNDSLEFA